MELQYPQSFSFSCASLTLLYLIVVYTYALGGNETDRLALMKFKAMITHDPFGIMSSWNDSKHFCQWPGVTCGRQHQRVIVLDLQSMRLAGSISPHIGNLSFLRELKLQNNSFTHQIPSEIAHLRRLQRLYLFNNSIGGEIPSNTTGCSRLVEFDVSDNQLVGEIPPDIGSLSKLQIIYVLQNSLSSTIPPSLGNLSSLEILYLSQNLLSGSIPDTLGDLMNLEKLVLEGNELSGTIPPSIFNLSSLSDLGLGFNQFHGTLPPNLGIKLPELRNLEMFKCGVTGNIPGSLSNASNLEELQLQGNGLTGKVPMFGNSPRLFRFLISNNFLGDGGANDLNFLSSLTNATSLELLSISSNHFGGMIPKIISNLSTNLLFVDLGDNQLFGSIPTGIENLVKLLFLSLSRCHLSGNIPSVIGKLQNLQLLDLHSNELSGHIPSSIGNLTELNNLNLYENSLHGNIPFSLGNCQNLIQLDLSYNNLNGDIPPQVMSISSLSTFVNFSHNHLTGALPIEVNKLINLGTLDVSENMLSGEIPSSLGSCVRLEIIYMQGNSFQGPIPSSLSSLKGLQKLDISKNNLSGEIPKFFENFRFLQLLNLSYNNFEGTLPDGGTFKNSSAISIMGNNKLCGGLLEFHLPSCNFKHPKRKLTLPLKIASSIFSGLLCISLVLSFFLCLSRKKRMANSSSPDIAAHFMVSYQGLLHATNGFSSTNLIGMGSFGSVFKGVLPNGMIVAIKVFNLIRHGASRSFMSECETLRNIRHRNLVKVLTACSGIDYIGNDFKALVYEYMANGSLEEWLHPMQRMVEAPEEAKSLNFLQRLNVAIDVVCALDYLHHQCQIPIVHCDLKPNNVLLDDDMTGHVGDFGLARFLQVQEVTHDFSTSQSSSIGIRGTIGYAAPEYGMGSEVSIEGDVYSYGILLLEIFTGKRPIDEMFKESLNLHNYVRTALPDRATTIIDPILLEEIFEEETRMINIRNQRGMKCKSIRDCLISIFEIGVACSTEFPKERKKIEDAGAELISIKKSFLNHRRLVERRNN